jgi:hypothetical protein
MLIVALFVSATCHLSAQLTLASKQAATASYLAIPGDRSMTSFALVALGLALVAAVFALGREIRLRKALEKLLRILMSRWRAHVSKNHSPDVDRLDHTNRSD